MTLLTNTELAILGLVAEAPKHAYRLEQEIAERGMRDWTDIGFSSIYHVLNKLADAGLMESELRAEGQGPARRVYSLTESGWTAYRAGVETRLAHPRPRTGDFILGLANLPALSAEEVCQALRTHQAIQRQKLDEVRAKQVNDETIHQARGAELPEHVNSLFDYATTLMVAELDWVEAFLQKNACGEKAAE